jgi:hypothetical protein
MSPQIPHTPKGYGQPRAVVSCHVERPLDDEVWIRFAQLQRARPGGFRVAALMRPPWDGEDEERWLERAREASRRGPLGHHTHWGGPAQARPTGGDPAERVRREGAWLREAGLAPTLFCGGGWYLDAGVAEAVAELGYVDCTATGFRPGYLPPDAPRAALAEPARLVLSGGLRVLELPSTHSLGAAARSSLGRLPAHVHVYFHDTDLLVPRRRLALAAALRVLGRRRRALDLDELAAEVDPAEVPFSSVASAR